MPSRFTASSSSTSSSVSPLDEIARSTSLAVSMPRSPCSASAACRKNDGDPVLANVAAIFRPISPDLPSPVTTTRPLQACKSSTAFSKRASRRSISPAIASASIRRHALGGCERLSCRALRLQPRLPWPTGHRRQLSLQRTHRFRSANRFRGAHRASFRPFPAAAVLSAESHSRARALKRRAFPAAGRN